MKNYKQKLTPIKSDVNSIEIALRECLPLKTNVFMQTIICPVSKMSNLSRVRFKIMIVYCKIAKRWLVCQDIKYYYYYLLYRVVTFFGVIGITNTIK